MLRKNYFTFMGLSCRFLQLRKSSTNIKEYKFDVDGMSINILETGSGKENVLLMPGALGSAKTDFKPQIEELPRLLPNYTVIAWDPPGYGNSIPPNRKFDSDFFSRDAIHANLLMERLNKIKYSILGWSDGGITALLMASKFPNNISKIVIWGANAYITEVDKNIYEGIKDTRKWSERMRKPMEDMYGERFPKMWSQWIDAMVSIYNEKKGDICKDATKKIECPTFILHGKKDPMLAEEHIPYLRKNLIKSEYYEFPEGKHNIHLRYSNEFNKIVANFLKCNK